MLSLSQIRAREAGPWSRLVTAIKDPNLVVVAVFCTIGLLASVNVMLRFPDFGAIIAQYN